MNIRILFIGMAFVLSSASCKKWIDVKPSDRLSEQMLFSTRDGYLKALNGVYVELANSSVYGQNMSAAALDVMAQYYYMVTSTHPYYNYTMFTYTADNTKLGFDNMWKKSYELIANCNVIIEKCGAQNSLLPAPYFGIVKGEALALRAMLHFDMLRLFGPIWSEEKKLVAAIPYKTNAATEVTPLLSSEAVMKNVLDDLSAAGELLREADPVITEGVRNMANPAGANDLYFRQYRLNYYAVRALKARAHLWMNEKDAALQEAQAVLNEVQSPAAPIFPYVTNAAATSADKPDRMFSTEVMFSLYTINRVNMYNNVFSASIQPGARLSFNAGNADMARVNELYDDENDYRRRIWENVTLENGTLLTNQKYKDYVDAPGRYMVPLIRLSELLLMGAECSATLEEGTAYLNALRAARNCVSLSPGSEAELKTAITAEFRKEMIGEGQMFFYYKRNAMQTIPNNAALIGTKTMVLENYVVPLPDSEISLRSK
ncbi:MAG: RagB/SusD family nutrient uptake outer membrane protein [Chitinophagaceae bacterium]